MNILENLAVGDTFWFCRISFNKGNRICPHYSETKYGPEVYSIISFSEDTPSYISVVGKRLIDGRESKFLFKYQREVGSEWTYSSEISATEEDAMESWNLRIREEMDSVVADSEKKLAYLKKQLKQ